MKKRYIYLLLFGVPGLPLALAATGALFGMVIGGLWLFAFGDGPWPPMEERTIAMLLVVTFTVIWTGCMLLGFSIGRRLEADPGFNANHVAASVLATAGIVALVLWHQFGVGNIGPASDSSRCSAFCSDHGYNASSLTPRDAGTRTCSCLDGAGRQATRIPLQQIKQ